MENRTAGFPADDLTTPQGRFCDLYRTVTESRCVVAEGTTGRTVKDKARIREKVVRCLWFDQFLEPAALGTEDGRKLTVFSPGYWNPGAGPDFRNAEIAFDDGPRKRGDVEVHVNAAEWNRHGHSQDPAYRKVALHVVLNDDMGHDSVLHGAREIPQLVLTRHLSAELSEILGSLDPDGYPRVGCGREGSCCRAIRAFGLGEDRIGRFLDIAGDERILSKSQRMEERAAHATPDDVLYEALMETMGYSNNRRGFRLLAKRVSLDQLRRFVPVDVEFGERLLVVQALLYGAAGFLAAAHKRPLDEKSQIYVQRLADRWAEVGLGQAVLDCTVWNLGRMRPTNQPVRRIAGISAFLAACLHTGLCRGMMTALAEVSPGGSEAARCRRTMARLCAMFETGHQEYWAHRTTFGPESLSRSTRLIGRARACEMVVNVVIPLLLTLSRRNGQVNVEQRLHNLYCALPPVSENAVTRYMRTRIFGDTRGGTRVVRSMRRQQGLLQIFHDYCEHDTQTCDDCGFLAFVEGRTR